MSVEQIADKADMIVDGYAFLTKGDYIEVIDLNDPEKRAIIQNDEVVESIMDDSQDEIILECYNRNKDVLEESVYA